MHIKATCQFVVIFGVLSVLCGCVSYKGYNAAPVGPYKDDYRPLILFHYTKSHSGIGIKGLSYFGWDRKPFGLKMKIFAHEVDDHQAKEVIVTSLKITPVKEVIYRNHGREAIPCDKKKSYYLVAPDNPFTINLELSDHHYMSNGERIQKKVMMGENDFKGIRHNGSFNAFIEGVLIYENGDQKEFMTTKVFHVRKEFMTLPFWVLQKME